MLLIYLDLWTSTGAQTTWQGLHSERKLPLSPNSYHLPVALWLAVGTLCPLVLSMLGVVLAWACTGLTHAVTRSVRFICAAALLKLTPPNTHALEHTHTHSWLSESYLLACGYVKFFIHLQILFSSLTKNVYMFLMEWILFTDSSVTPYCQKDLTIIFPVFLLRRLWKKEQQKMEFL